MIVSRRDNDPLDRLDTSSLIDRSRARARTRITLHKAAPVQSVQSWLKSSRVLIQLIEGRTIGFHFAL